MAGGVAATAGVSGAFGADGAVAAAGGGVVGAAVLGAAAGGGESALTALLQPEESLAILRCRHCSASIPPGFTLEQFDMKSDRQLLRIALCCAWVGCAKAYSAWPSRANAKSPVNVPAPG